MLWSVNFAGVVLTLAGWGAEATALFVVGVALAIAALRMFEAPQQEAKTRGVHRSFPFFIRMAYGWLLAAALLGVGAALWDSSGGIWGASRHALTVGFIAVMVLCVGQRILPAFAGMRLLWSTRLMFAGLALLTTRMHAACFQRGSRLSGLRPLGVVGFAGFGDARIGGDHRLRREYLWDVHSRTKPRAETASGGGNKIGTSIGLFREGRKS